MEEHWEMSEPRKWGEMSQVLLAPGENALTVQAVEKSVLAFLKQKEKRIEVLSSKMFDLIIICDAQRSLPSP